MRSIVGTAVLLLATALVGCKESNPMTVQYDLGGFVPLDGGTTLRDGSTVRDGTVPSLPDGTVVVQEDMNVEELPDGSVGLPDGTVPSTPDGSVPCTGGWEEPNNMNTTSRFRALELKDTVEDHDNFVGILQSEADVDWYYWNVVDGTGDLGDPTLTIVLTSPSGQNYTLQSYFDCNDGTASNSCESGVTDVTYLSMGGQGCNSDDGVMTTRTNVIETECSGGGDGRLFVKVQAKAGGFLPMCANYTLDAVAE